MIRGLGYEIYKIHTGSISGIPLYEAVTPSATYSPWNEDESFLKMYHTVRKHTMVDRYRCFELWSLVEQTRKLDGSLIEIGVWRGGTGALIAKKASLCSITDSVYLCDTFAGVVKVSDKDSTYKGGEHSDTSQQTVESLIKNLGLANVRILKGVFPNETSRLVERDTFRFCHIDVDVYQSAKDIVEWIWPRMVTGGVIVYDDYGFIGCDGIRDYVNEQSASNDRLIMHNLNGHAVVVKIG